MDPVTLLPQIRSKANLSLSELAQLLGTSAVSVARWERGASSPSPAQAEKIAELHEAIDSGGERSLSSEENFFSSRGIRDHVSGQGALGTELAVVRLTDDVHPAVLTRLRFGQVFDSEGEAAIAQLLKVHGEAASTAVTPTGASISAGKNTYTYDAHTYHTKVPPQGIVELLAHYLPQGGLVLDPFSGSGMTGVAARALGYDCILNELSPAACFISNRFTSSSVSPDEFEAAVHAVIAETADLRRRLYTTQCRECGRSTELLYAVVIPSNGPAGAG